MSGVTSRGTIWGSHVPMAEPTLEREASYARVAAKQYGLITSEQLLGLGLSRSSISRRVRAGTLIPVLPTVYRLAGVARSWHQRVFSAHLWAGAESVICGRAAAALHRLDAFAACSEIDVATPRSLKAAAEWTIVRRPRSFDGRDRVVVDGIPVLSPTRTLIDVAGCATEAQLELALEDARRRNLVTPEQLERRLSALPPNQIGRGKLLKVLALLTGTRPSESNLEVKVTRLLRREGYPDPIRQEVLDDNGGFAGRVDLIYPDRKLIIEVHSHRWHSDRRAGDADSERTNRHQAMGWVVMVARHSMLKGEGRATFLRDLARTYGREVA